MNYRIFIFLTITGGVWADLTKDVLPPAVSNKLITSLKPAAEKCHPEIEAPPTLECNQTLTEEYVKCIEQKTLEKHKRVRRDCSGGSDCAGSSCGNNCANQCSSCRNDCSTCNNCGNCNSCNNCASNCCFRQCNQQCQTYECRRQCRATCEENVQMKTNVTNVVNSPQNITTVIRMINTVNDNTDVRIPVQVNSSTVSNITIEDSSNPGLVIQQPPAELNLAIVSNNLNGAHNQTCCHIVLPRECVSIEKFPFLRCFHRRRRTCGSICLGQLPPVINPPYPINPIYPQPPPIPQPQTPIYPPYQIINPPMPVYPQQPLLPLPFYPPYPMPMYPQPSFPLPQPPSVPIQPPICSIQPPTVNPPSPPMPPPRPPPTIISPPPGIPQPGICIPPPVNPPPVPPVVPPSLQQQCFTIPQTICRQTLQQPNYQYPYPIPQPNIYQFQPGWTPAFNPGFAIQPTVVPNTGCK